MQATGNASEHLKDTPNYVTLSGAERGWVLGLVGKQRRNPSAVGGEQREMPENLSGAYRPCVIRGAERGWALGLVGKHRRNPSAMGGEQWGVRQNS